MYCTRQSHSRTKKKQASPFFSASLLPKRRAWTGDTGPKGPMKRRRGENHIKKEEEKTFVYLGRQESHGKGPMGKGKGGSSML